MKKVLIFVIVIVLIVVAALIFDKGKLMKKPEKNKGLAPSEVEGPVREPAVAGSFYPADKTELSAMVDGFLSQVKTPEIKGSVRAIIVPHAGYVYSGWVAAYGFKALIGSSTSSEPIKTVVLIGSSHHEYFDGASVYPKGYYKTPLGNVEIDADFVKKLMAKSDKISYHETADAEEHSLEVQLPFLQRTLKNFKIVPIILGNQPGVADILINALKDLIDENTLIIASSDLSHYPKYEDAKYSDNKVIQAILTGKRENLRKTIADLEKENIPNLQTCACGHDSIEVVMALMEGKKAQLLKSANSGDVEIGDKNQVVGYATIVFMSDSPSTGSGLLSKQQQKRLLEIAKQSVETYIKTGKVPEIKNDFPALEKHLGAFVTLKKHEELRGCIGRFQPDIPLYQVVIQMAIAAATEDTRFSPVTKDELKDLEYEISVLSPLQKVDSWKDVEIGKHGVEIIKGSYRGVFLPQVATENNWDRETFLSILCTQKAGLSADCYKDKDTEIYVFTAQVFREK